MNKECLQCGNIFRTFPSEIKREHGRFCSRSCSGKYIMRNNPRNIYGDPETRFYKKIINTGAYWIWDGLKNKQGYGRMIINKKEIPAHRYSWELKFGKIPEGLLACHKCDTPPCVNPDHIFLGTYKDNAIDRSNKNRNRDQSGEKHNCAKLTDKKVYEIKIKLKKGIKCKFLSKEYDVSETTIYNIKNGKKWRHLLWL